MIVVVYKAPPGEAGGPCPRLSRFFFAVSDQVVKLQRSFLVEDRVLVFTEAKQHVDNCKVQEMQLGLKTYFPCPS